MCTSNETLQLVDDATPQGTLPRDVLYCRYMARMTIPKKLAGSDDLVIVPKKEFDDLLARAENAIEEQDILRWSAEAKELHRTGKLPKLASSRGL